MIFVSYLTAFSYFALREIAENSWTQSEHVKNGLPVLKRGCRWFQLFFIHCQLFYYLTRINPVYKLNFK